MTLQLPADWCVLCRDVCWPDFSAQSCLPICSRALVTVVAICFCGWGQVYCMVVHVSQCTALTVLCWSLRIQLMRMEIIHMHIEKWSCMVHTKN